MSRSRSARANRAGHGRKGASIAASEVSNKQRPEAPEPLPATAVDSHCHLDIIAGSLAEDGFPGVDVDGELKAAATVGITRVVQVGVDVASSRWSADLAARRPDVLAMVAIHPNEAGVGAATNEALAEIDRLAAQPGVRGIGETGLDHFRTQTDGWATQEESFRAHIDIAKRRGIALMIHTRDAYEDMLRVLDEEGAPENTVLHCYSSDAEMARRCLDRGLVLSFSGTVTFANARAAAQAAAITPIDQMLVETDAPFLTPSPFRGRPNAPYLTPYTIRALADLTGTDLATLCEQLTATAERVFGPWPFP
ncbi:MAG: TatD family hydrolase [Geodermatophilaceae bacterium]|nr:TatD family hydrolase [Geodermatophilaceae bacterium]